MKNTFSLSPNLCENDQSMKVSKGISKRRAWSLDKLSVSVKLLDLIVCNTGSSLLTKFINAVQVNQQQQTTLQT